MHIAEGGRLLVDSAYEPPPPPQLQSSGGGYATGFVLGVLSGAFLVVFVIGCIFVCPFIRSALTKGHGRVEFRKARVPRKGAAEEPLAKSPIARRMTRKLSNVSAELDLSERSIPVGRESPAPLTTEAKALVNERVERARRVRGSVGSTPSLPSQSQSPTRSLPTRHSNTRGTPPSPRFLSQSDEHDLNPDYQKPAVARRPTPDSDDSGDSGGARGLFV